MLSKTFFNIHIHVICENQCRNEAAMSFSMVLIDTSKLKNNGDHKAKNFLLNVNVPS